MSKLKLKNDEIFETIIGKVEDFPKYTTQIINLANQNAQGTRPKVVGQMSDLIQEFSGKKYGDWVTWYEKKMPTAVDDATDKVYDMVTKLKGAFVQIDKELVRKWVRDLVLTKTFVGLCFQESLLKKVANLKGKKYRLSTPVEESKGIDGFIGDTAVSIKPLTYKSKNMLSESIDVAIIYYDKKKDGIVIEFDF